MVGGMVSLMFMNFAGLLITHYLAILPVRQLSRSIVFRSLRGSTFVEIKHQLWKKNYCLHRQEVKKIHGQSGKSTISQACNRMKALHCDITGALVMLRRISYLVREYNPFKHCRTVLVITCCNSDTRSIERTIIFIQNCLIRQIL